MKQFRLIFTFAIVSLFFGCEKKENLPEPQPNLVVQEKQKQPKEEVQQSDSSKNKKNSPCENGGASLNLSTQIVLNYKDQSGKNLFDSTASNAYDIEKVRLYYLTENNTVEEVTPEGKLKVGGKGFSLNKDNTLFVFTPPYRTQLVKKTAEYDVFENTAYIRLSETEIDTIKTHDHAGCGYFVVSKVWYNGKLVTPSEGDALKTITITKKKSN